MILAAAPDYLRSAEPISTAGGLAERAAVVFTAPDQIRAPWTLSGEGETFEVDVRLRFRTDSSEAARAALLAGAGIGLIPLWLVTADLDEGSSNVSFRT